MAFCAAAWAACRSRRRLVEEHAHIDALSWPKTPVPFPAEVDIAVRFGVGDGKHASLNLASAALTVTVLEYVYEDLGRLY